MRSALETVELFWKTQNDRDYSRLVELFSDDAVVEDPVYGTFTGGEAIAGFMAKMNEVMTAQETHFELVECAGGGETAWAQWVAHTPRGKLEGCGLYRVRDGLLTYYRDYINREPSGD